MKKLIYILLVVTIFGCQKEDDDTTGTFTDTRDGHVYKWVKIGNQTWMAENLDYRTTDSSWYYNDDSITYHGYGRLYTWERAFEAVPSGWHLPTDAEWTTLTTYLGGEDIAGGKLKEAGLVHWTSPNTGATDASGFTALPGGIRYDNATFNYTGDYGFWWSWSGAGQADAWYRQLVNTGEYVFRHNYDERFGLSVRCVKD